MDFGTVQLEQRLMTNSTTEHGEKTVKRKFDIYAIIITFMFLHYRCLFWNNSEYRMVTLYFAYVDVCHCLHL